MTDQSGYFINQELLEEMVRLNRQAYLVTREMGGVLPEPLYGPTSQDVLDLACGPGEWVMQMASSYPHLHHVVGVDKSQRMIAYANAQAEAEEIHEASFRVMDVTQPLDFPDHSFSLVNGRFLLSFMRREQWPFLLSECSRILRPGGVLYITEQESGYTNDPVYQRYIDVWGEACRKAGHAFAFTPAYIGVTVMLKQIMMFCLRAGMGGERACGDKPDMVRQKDHGGATSSIPDASSHRGPPTSWGGEATAP